jgi:hypothetical protein
VAALEHAAVMAKPTLRGPPRLGLESRPLDREAVAVQAEVAKQRDVVGIAVEVIARLPRPLRTRSAGGAFPLVPIVGGVAALDLVGRGGGTPEEGERREPLVVPYAATSIASGPRSGIRSVPGIRPKIRSDSATRLGLKAER